MSVFNVHTFSRSPRPRVFAGVSWVVAGFFIVSWLATDLAQSELEKTAPAEILRSQYRTLSEQPNNAQFKKPLYLDSQETDKSVAGDIHALIDHSFASVAGTLSKTENWCDIFILHLNTKYCRAVPGEADPVIKVYIGRKSEQPLEDASQVNFKYTLVEKTADYLQVKLHADAGPLGTSDYRIVIEAAALDDKRTIVHLAYSYSFGLMGRLAMNSYLGTAGRDKVGFTVTGKQEDGQPIYVKGIRGVVERNTMRYYLALEVFFDALATRRRPVSKNG